MAMTSLQWKRLYAQEREELLEQTLDFFLDVDTPMLPEFGAVIFPHTKLMASVAEIVPAALAVVHSGVTDVLAIGPLHGGPEGLDELIRRARSGEADAVSKTRGVHPAYTELTMDEYALDTFTFLVDALAGRLGRKPPKVHPRYPFLTGEDPLSLPGFRGLQRLRSSGAAVVVTADLIHHGVGYRTPKEQLRIPHIPGTVDWVRSEISESLRLLSGRDYPGFVAHSRSINSDFRETGPVLRELLPGEWETDIQSVRSVDYAGTLNVPAPTWVSSALITIKCT